MLKIAKMGFLLFCGLRCHCSASSSAASALLHFSRARAAVKCSKKCQAKIVYYIFRPCTQRHTVENLCPTLNGMQAKVLPNSLPLPLRGHPRTRAWRSVAAAKGSLAKLWHIFSPFATFHLRTTNRRWHWTLLRCHHALFRKPKKGSAFCEAATCSRCLLLIVVVEGGRNQYRKRVIELKSVIKSLFWHWFQ